MSKIYVILFLSFICVNICGASTDSRKRSSKNIKVSPSKRWIVRNPISIKLAQGCYWNRMRNIKAGSSRQQPFRYQMPQLERGQFHHGR